MQVWKLKKTTTLTQYYCLRVERTMTPRLPFESGADYDTRLLLEDGEDYDTRLLFEDGEDYDARLLYESGEDYESYDTRLPLKGWRGL